MKIHSVYFKNINSLKGEYRLAFDRGPLADAGVFAITGPNGSGKSTILDVITLGLYGQTFRFDRPADHVMTKHTADCFAEVVFSFGGGKKFRALWRAGREGGAAYAKVLPPEMRLTQLNGEEKLLADQPQQMRDMVTELTGLDFRRFTRTIMLAQGDFAAFLNALDSERLDILEKIISADIYAEFKKDIEAKAAQTHAEIQRLQTEIEALALFEPARIEAHEYDLQDFEEQFGELKQRKNELQQQQNWLHNLDVLQKRLEQLHGAQVAAERQIEMDRANLQKAETAQHMLDFAGDMQAVDGKIAAIARDRDYIAGLQQDQAQLQSALQARGAEPTSLMSEPATADELQSKAENIKARAAQIELDRQTEAGMLEALQRQSEEKRAALQTVNNWLESNRSEQILVDDFPDIGKLKKLRIDLAGLQDKQKSFSRWQKLTFSTLERNRSGMSRASRKIVALKRKLQSYEHELQIQSQGHSQEEIAALRAGQQERVVQFKRLLDLAESNERLAKIHTKTQSRLRGSDMDAASLKVEYQTLNDKYQREQNIKKILEQAVNQEAIFKRFAAERVHLIDGKPCPLCGSLDHPYAHQTPASGDSKRALADQQRKLLNLQTVLQRLEVQIQAAEKLAQQAQDEDQRLQQVRSQWLSICSRLNQAGSEMRIDNFRFMKRVFKNERAELSDIIALEKKCLRLRAKCSKLKLLVERHEALAEQLQSTTTKLDTDWNNRPQDLKDLEQAYEACRAEHDAVAEKVLKQLASIGEKMPSPNREDMLFDRLNVRRQDYRTYQLRSESLQQDLHDIEAKITACQAKLNDCAAQVLRCNAELQSGETAALHFILLEKQKLLADKEQALARQQEELTAMTRALLEKTAPFGFTTLETVRDILALVNSREKLQLEIAALQQQMQQTATQIADSQAQLQAEQALAVTTLTPQEVDVQLRDVAGKMDIVSEEIRHAEAVLFEQNKLRSQEAELKARLEQQQQQYDTYRNDLQQAGSADFRRRVQKHMADNLLHKANEYLQKISGRYLLHQAESEYGLALDVEDTYQQNARRLPKSLSGGESFVVSLALSLGLSELANNGNSVDSLFLDEGFGNLDREVLELVVKTLKDLHKHGKTVGVISHVKRVEELIDTKVLMSKRLDGISELAIAS